MDNSFSNTEFDFDLSFLNHTPKNIAPVNVYEKQKKAISIVKKKTVATDTLIRRYYEKKESLEEADRALLASKEECKQLCIDYKNVSERLLQLENEKHTFSTHYQDLEEKCITAQNQFGALQSHCNQLQLLVKENESTIDTLKLENKLEKTTIAKGKSQITRLLRKNKLLQKNIALLKDVVIGKKKVTDEHRAIYNVVGNKGHVSEDSDSGSEHTRIEICEWNEVSDSPGSPDGTQKNAEAMIKKEAFSDIKSGIKHKESDDVTSVDTGRGSSLAFSDSEKCFQSPDYYMIDSPTNIGRNRLKSVATSPVHIHYISASTSPIHFSNDDSIDIDIKDGEKHCLSDQEKCVAVENPKKTVDRAVSPIQYTEPETKTTDIATSPIFFETEPAEEATLNSNIHHETKTKNTFVPITIDQAVDVECPRTITRSENSSTHSPPILSPFKGFSREEINNVITSVNISKKYCLQINNSNNFSDEDTSDYEIETIFGDMRLKDKMITPIPITPVQPRKIKKPKNRKTEKDKGLPIIIENDENVIQSQPKKEQGYPMIENRKNVIQSQPGKDERHLILENRQNAIQNQARNDKGRPKIENVQILENRQNTIQKQPCKDKGLPNKIENIQNVIQSQPEKDKGRPKIENVQIIQSPPGKDQRHFIIENRQNTIQKQPCKDKGLPIKIENMQNVIQNQPEKDKGRLIIENVQIIRSPPRKDQRHIIIENPQNTIQKHQGKDKGLPVIIENNQNIIQSQPEKYQCHPIVENRQNAIQNHLGTDQRHFIIENRQNTIQKQPGKDRGHPLIENVQIIQSQPGKDKGRPIIENIQGLPIIIEKNENIIDVKISEENKILHESIAHLAKEIMSIKDMLQNKLAPEENHVFYTQGNINAHDFLCQPQTLTVQPGNYSSIEFEPLQGFDAPMETCNIPQEEAPFYDDGNDMEQPEEGFDLEPPIETCNITQPTDDINEVEHPEENLDLDPPIETCNITQPIDTLDICPPLSLNPKLSSELSKETNDIKENRETSESKSNTVLNRLHFENMVSSTNSFEDSNMVQSNSRTASPDIIRCSYEDLNDSKTQQSTSPDAINVTLPDIINEKTPQKNGNKTKVKLRKLTRLQKMRKKLIPKSKIKNAVSPLKKSPRLSLTKISIKPEKKVITEQDNAATLNNKDVYEKALKVMAELKSQKNYNRPKNNKFIKRIKNIENSSLDLKSDKELTPKTIPEKCKVNNVEVSPPANNELNISRNRKYSLELRSDKELTPITAPEKCKVNNVEVSPPANNELNISRNRKYSLELRSDKELTPKPAPEKCKVDNIKVSPANNELNISRNRKYSRDLSSDKELTPIMALEKFKVNNVEVSPPANNNELNFSRNRKYSLELRSDKELTPITAPEKCKVNNVEISPPANNELNISRNRKYSRDLRSDKELTPITAPEICKVNNVEVFPPANNNELNFSRNRKYSRDFRCDKELTPLTAPEKCKVNNVEVFPPANNNKLNFSRNRKYSLELRSDKESTPEKCNINNVETSPPANYNESNISKNRKSRITSQTDINCSDLEIRKSRKRSAALDPELGVENKRILRSSLRLSQSESSVTIPVKTEIIDLKPCVIKISKDILLPGNEYNMHQNTPIKSEKVAEHTKIDKPQNKKEDAIIEQTRCIHPKDSLLCCVIEKFASSKGRQPPKKCKESITNNVCKTIETGITHIIELTSEDRKPAMKKLADELSRWQLNNFLSGLMKYFKNPERKTEMFNKVTCFPAPSMTKSEQILLYVLNILQCSNPWKENVIFKVLNAMEFTIFQLNNTPEFDVIESMSHFYAVLCRFTKSKSRLRLFMLDAMYCIQFKAIPLIRQCMDVWMHILPLAHMAAAQSTLVTCLVYLLHFYKCEDRMKRVSEIRIILQKKYFFDITEWNDIKILEMFRKSIIQLKDISVEKKMLRMALIILAKRMGPKWCQQNIIKNLLIPTIENPNTPHKAKEFCVSMLGPIMRPYPTDMKIHCEIVINLLLDMLNQNPTPRMEEAIFTSLLYIQHRSFNRIIQELLGWNPSHVSPEFEELLKDFVKSKPIKLWKALLSKVPLN